MISYSKVGLLVRRLNWKCTKHLREALPDRVQVFVHVQRNSVVSSNHDSFVFGQLCSERQSVRLESRLQSCAPLSGVSFRKKRMTTDLSYDLHCDEDIIT
jgi:hypothetical protein